MIACRSRALAALVLATLAGAAQAFGFAVFGDMPYTAVDALAVQTMLADIDRQDLAFVIHVGDLKSSAEPCSDALFQERRALLDRSRAPLVYVPGDNEWTDCWTGRRGPRYDPEERLARLRALFFGTRLVLGGRNATPPELVSQGRLAGSTCPRCVEHLRWMHEGVMFVTLNVPGSNNNLERNAAMDDEHRVRMQAVRWWLEAAVTAAIGAKARALVVIFHADPGFERSRLPAPTARPDGYVDFRRQLAQAARRFQRPMLALHGDTHLYKDDHPLVDAATGVLIGNLRRVEVMGYPFLGWVRIDVGGSATAASFTVTPIRVVAGER